MCTLKPSSICDIFSTIVPCFTILSLVNKFDSIVIEIDQKEMQSLKKIKSMIKLKKTKNYKQ
jgi:hypothetical protein